MRFHNREDELEELERVWKLCDRGLHFSVISGRRRVGKTELVKQHCKDKDSSYFFVGRKQPTPLLDEFCAIAQADLGQFPRLAKFDDFLDLLLARTGDKRVIVFDEFQNFDYVDRSVFSDFQKVIDRSRGSRTHLIVTGSQASILQRIFSDSKEPLFGRATERYPLRPLDFRAICGMLDDLRVSDSRSKVEWYATFGGMPKYYVLAEEQGLEERDVIAALDSLLFRDFAPLHDEARGILAEEFGAEHKTYFSILEAVALGNCEMSNIADKSGISIKSIGKYLSLLVNEYGFLTHSTPITESRAKSKKGRYFLSDRFMSFWFRYVHRNMSDYEIGNFGRIKAKVRDDFNAFVGSAFEEIARQFLLTIQKPFEFDAIGKWWSRTEEIDLVGMKSGAKEIALFEVKWQDLSLLDAERLLSSIERKKGLVLWGGERRKEHFGIIARSIEGKDGLRSLGIQAYDLDDVMEKLLA